MRRAPLPLSRSPLVRTRDVAEAVELQSRLSSPVVGVHVDRRLPFRWEANAARFAEIHLVVGRYGAATRAGTRNVDGHYSLAVARNQTMRATQAKFDAEVVHAGRAALVSPGMPAQFDLDAHYEGTQVLIPSRAVEQGLTSLTEMPATPLRFDLSVDVSDGAGAHAMRLLDHIIDMIERDVEALRSPIIRGRLTEALVYTLLLGLPHSHSALVDRPARPLEPPYVRRAAEYLAANADRHVDVADLVAVTGASARAIFAGFRVHRGRSPMTFLRDRRFDLARHRLTAPSPSATVSEVALACGFEHLGRFSVGYRARFGESPVETLRRRRGADARGDARSG